ncbi:MAG: hypothetical protein II833_00060 [Pseudobutyrivibrio sp.]|nr:hypothetical protein [Pseudobutyrivibrio sp.]
MKNELLKIQGNKESKKEENRYLGKRIAVVGAAKSVGTTKIAISMCMYLNKNKIDAYYKDEKSDTVHNLLKNLHGARLKDGVLYHKNFKGILNYGDAIENITPPIGMYIVDCGTDYDLAMSCDRVIIVTGSSPWISVSYPEWIRDKSVYVIGNMCTKLACIKLAKELKKKIYMYPQTGSANGLAKEEERIIQELLRNERDF